MAGATAGLVMPVTGNPLHLSGKSSVELVDGGPQVAGYLKESSREDPTW
jgi:hypothetical protein